MDRSSQSQAQQAVHPSEAMKQDWIVSSQSIHSGGLIVQHYIEPADEIETLPMTHHFLPLMLHSTSSRQVTRFDDREYDGKNLDKGDLLILPASLPGLFAWDGTDETVIFLLHPSQLADVAVQTECVNPDRIELRPTLIGHDPKLEFIASTFHQEMQCDGLGGQMYAESLANLFTIHLLRHYCTTQPHLRTFKSGLPRQQLQQVIDYMQAHLDQSLGLNELANVLGMNSHYFWKQFKQSMGMPPHQYLIQCRVDRAKQLLKQKNLPLTEIAAQCGFADQSHLNRHFRKRLGMAPSTYRNSLR